MIIEALPTTEAEAEAPARNTLPLEIQMAWKATSMENLKRLAQQAGLLKPAEPEVLPDELIEAFAASASGLLERAAYSDDAHALRKEDERSVELREIARQQYVADLREEYSKNAAYENKPGIYQFTAPDGKKFRSWLHAKRPVATLRQIAAMAARKYPNYSIDVFPVGTSRSRSGGYSVLPNGAIVPRYEVFFSKQLPDWVHTRERVFLQEGKLLSEEDLANLWKGKDFMLPATFQQKLDELIQHCPTEEPCLYERGWEQLDDRGEFHPFEEDDTRDRPESRSETEYVQVETISPIWHEDDWWAHRGSHRAKHANAYQWEEEEPEMNDDLDLHLSLRRAPEGLPAQVFDDAFEQGRELASSQLVRGITI